MPTRTDQPMHSRFPFFDRGVRRLGPVLVAILAALMIPLTAIPASAATVHINVWSGTQVSYVAHATSDTMQPVSVSYNLSTPATVDVTIVGSTGTVGTLLAATPQT